MKVSRRQASWLVILFFAALVAVVFQQIHTSMTEQGIASGGPYDNAAAYPKAVAVLIGLMIAVQSALLAFGGDRGSGQRLGPGELRRPAGLLLIFGIYLALLGVLGYHLTTAPMVIGVMALCGMRNPVTMLLAGLGISFSLAYFFEAYLKIVLPGGIFGLNIPW